MISGPYNVTFKKRTTNPVDLTVLREQIKSLGLDRFDIVIGLGGKEYISIIKASFEDMENTMLFPFAGLKLGIGMSAIKKAIELGKAY